MDGHLLDVQIEHKTVQIQMTYTFRRMAASLVAI